MNCQNTYSPISHLNSRNWTIVLALPNAQSHIIGRFRNRQDAEDSARFLRCSVPTAKFEVVFDAPDFETSQPLNE